MSARNSTGDGGGAGLLRLTPQQTRQRLEGDRAPRYAFVDGGGTPIARAVALPLQPPDPLSPAPVVLPVRVTAEECALRAEGEATAFATQAGYERQRQALQVRLAHERAEALSQRARRREAEARLEAERTACDEFVQELPRRLRRLLRRRSSRLFKYVPWALFGADVGIISRAYGLLGPLPLPFRASVGVTNLTEVARAGLISFGLVFGLRLVGGKLKEAVWELRERWGWLGLLCDGLVGGLVVFGAVRLAESTAQMQATLLQLTAGGSSLHLPTSVLFSIGAFLASVSLACGYFLSEPELEEASSREERVSAAEADHQKARAAYCAQLGVVRATRAELHSLEEQETLALAENAAHTDQRVWALKAGNVPLYGLEQDAALATGGGGQP